ncbi:MAG: hypothetical protein M2R45_05089 [Verrucomicrobia subdivision 3 bacterium]|nr:hypothetical protein [Limisphaerales bacterium]MCS1417166.1 hypothetical protein [Limisphaerales bacterium]
MRSANPVLNTNTFAGLRSYGETDTMTINGTVLKTGALLFMVVFGAVFTWNKTMAGSPPMGWMAVGGLGGFLVVLATMFKKEWAPFTAPLYAGLKGLFLGGMSAFFEKMYPDIVFNAVCLTFGTLFSLLFIYQVGWIKVTQNFRLGLFAATGGIMLFYLVAMVLGLFGISVPLIHSTGLFGIGFSLFVVVIAALNLVLDFDFIENGAAAGAPKYMEWYGALALLVTLVWLYIEILHLLSKLQRRD